MTKLLYWMIYHFDLGPIGPRVLDLAVRRWLRQARHAQAPVVRRQDRGRLTTFKLQPAFGGDERL